MSVQFADLVFRNNNNIAVTLTVQAPIGTVIIGPQTVPENSHVTLHPGIDNCVSVLLIANDTTHGEFKQSFGMASPSSGRSSFLESVDVRYVIASFSGSVKARTE
jgi:hypothetical protein